MKISVTSMMVTVSLLSGMLLIPLEANASHCWRDKHNHRHCDEGHHYGWSKHHDDRYYDSRTDRILKGGLLGAGIGAGAGVLLDRPIGKSAVLGAGIGAGTQAIRTSHTLSRHPVARTAAYGTLIGAGASQLGHEGSLGKGALWGAAIGTGVGVLKHSD